MADTPMQFDDSELDIEVQPNEALTKAVMELDEITTRIATGKKLLKQLNEEKHELEHHKLVAIMQEIGTNVYGIPETDRECRIKPYFHATFPKQEDGGDPNKAVEYLEGHALDGVVSHTLTVAIPRGKGEEAKQIQQRVQQMLAEYEINALAELKYGSHWKTYTAMVQEQFEEGNNLDWTLLNATIGQKASITKRK